MKDIFNHLYLFSSIKAKDLKIYKITEKIICFHYLYLKATNNIKFYSIYNIEENSLRINIEEKNIHKLLI
jgi:hypothetical protein